MKNDYYVYMHLFPNGKRYIGVTCCKPNRRWQNGYGYRNQPYIWNAICKYGWENIEHIVIAENLTSKQAGLMEAELIKKYRSNEKDNGYNIDQGGLVGYHLSSEIKRKISNANSGVNNGMYGYKYTDEERRYMSEHSVWKGKKHSKESIEKMRLAAIGNTSTKKGKEHHMAKGVKQYDLKGNLIAQFDTEKEAEEKTGILRSTICSCAKGKIKTASGYIWIYDDRELTDEELKKRTSFNYNIKSCEGFKRKVNQYDLDGKYIKTYNSVTEAQISVDKANQSRISAVCKGKYNSAYGFIWRYV